MNIANDIYNAAIDSGYANCGIISPDMILGYDDMLKERIKSVPSSEGFYQGMMTFSHVKERYPWARSLIICVHDYSKYRYPEEIQGRYAKAFFLSPEEGRTDGYDKDGFETWLTAHGIRWDGFNDFPLRYSAMQAGMGIIRRNNFFYTENGSYVVLLGYVTDMDCTLIHEYSVRPCSEKCTLCRKACRPQALCDAYTIDPMRCVSFWTTFGKGTVPEHLSEDMFEEWICGCDNCQDVCPYNRRKKWNEGEPFSELEKIAPLITPDRLSEQSDKFLRERVITKTDNHLEPTDTDVLRRCAERAQRFIEQNKN